MEAVQHLAEGCSSASPAVLHMAQLSPAARPPPPPCMFLPHCVRAPLWACVWGSLPSAPGWLQPRRSLAWTEGRGRPSPDTLLTPCT